MNCALPVDSLSGSRRDLGRAIAGPVRSGDDADQERTADAQAIHRSLTNAPRRGTRTPIPSAGPDHCAKLADIEARASAGGAPEHWRADCGQRVRCEGGDAASPEPASAGDPVRRGSTRRKWVDPSFPRSGSAGG